MARIIFKRADVAPTFIGDIGSRSNYTVYEHGQARYVGHYSNPTVAARIQAALDAASVSDITVAALGAATVDVNDCSLATIAGASAQLGAATAPQRAVIQEALAPKLVETGDVKLSFHQGVLKGLAAAFAYLGVSAPVVVVTQDDGVTPFVV